MEGSLQPLCLANPATRVLERCDEEGRPHSCGSFARVLSTCASGLVSLNALLVTSGLGRRKTTLRGRGLSLFGRGLNARWVCSRVVKRCRSRQAVPGSKKRDHRSLLTEHRFTRTGPSAHSEPARSRKAAGSGRMRAKNHRAPGRDGKVTGPEKGEFSSTDVGNKVRSA